LTVPLLPLFALTLFPSATLRFLVQPMVGKPVLPYLGGTPAVWNTCMVFFQAVLLAGYAYAHYVPRWFRPRTQLLAHAAPPCCNADSPGARLRRPARQEGRERRLETLAAQPEGRRLDR
jgi:hypothetical protein